jgi:predicted DNA-binding protein (MmcQ/YjbR family)
MRLPVLRAFALALPHTTVVRQWGEHLVFKVAGKMFLLIGLDGEVIETLSFKCSPEDLARLTDLDGIVPAPYLARASWVQVQDLGALRPVELEQQIRASYDLVWSRLPKKVRAELKTEG